MVLTGSTGFAGALGAFLVTGFAAAFGTTAFGAALLGFTSALVGLVSTLLEAFATRTSTLLSGFAPALAVGLPAGRATGFDGLATVMVLGFSVVLGVVLAVVLAVFELLLTFKALFGAIVLGLDAAMWVGGCFATFLLPVLEATLLLGVKLETALAGFAFIVAMRFALNVYPSLNVSINGVSIFCAD